MHLSIFATPVENINSKSRFGGILTLVFPVLLAIYLAFISTSFNKALETTIEFISVDTWDEHSSVVVEFKCESPSNCTVCELPCVFGAAVELPMQSTAMVTMPFAVFEHTFVTRGGFFLLIDWDLTFQAGKGTNETGQRLGTVKGTIGTYVLVRNVDLEEHEPSVQLLVTEREKLDGSNVHSLSLQGGYCPPHTSTPEITALAFQNATDKISIKH